MQKKKKSVCMKMLASKDVYGKTAYDKNAGGLYVARNWECNKELCSHQQERDMLGPESHITVLGLAPPACWFSEQTLSALVSRLRVGNGMTGAFVEIAGCGKLGEIIAYHLGRMKTDPGRLPDRGSMCGRTGKVEMEREVLVKPAWVKV